MELSPTPSVCTTASVQGGRLRLGRGHARISSAKRYRLGLGRSHSVVRYDERGCGLSDRDVGELSLEHWVADLERAANKEIAHSTNGHARQRDVGRREKSAGISMISDGHHSALPLRWSRRTVNGGASARPGALPVVLEAREPVGRLDHRRAVAVARPRGAHASGAVRDRVACRTCRSYAARRPRRRKSRRTSHARLSHAASAPAVSLDGLAQRAGRPLSTVSSRVAL